LGEIGVVEDGAMLISGGKIVAVGTTKELMRDPWLKKNRLRVQELDCAGKVVTPGFVDSHTHPVFARPRLVDFEKRVAGATYEEIAEAGGGIRASIKGVREASLKELTELTLEAFEEMARFGTTTVEAKSGYGLDYESEIKSLEAIAAAGKRWAGTVVATLLAAHTVPPEFKKNPQDYVRMICQVMIPEVADRELAKYVDVFCEKGAFTSADTERIFAAAEGNRLEVRAHMCQLSQTKLASLIARFKPASVDHMDFVSDGDVAEMAKMDTVATLVPGANYFLGTKAYPPARKLIDAGVPVALATDYNPGSSPTLSMPMVMSIACTQMKMTPAEALGAATINGAWALGMAGRKGSLERGKDADVAIWEADDYREIAYWFGENRCVGTLAGEEWIEG
jgi:imidazolonepropionase